MAETLSTIAQQVYIDLGQGELFEATGGSATTCANSFWGDLENQPEETRFKNSYIFVRRDAGGAGASPEQKYARITAYNTETYTLTHATVTDAIATGDLILFANTKTFPLFSVFNAINRGLKDLGYIKIEDSTTLDTVANQTEYTIPALFRGRPLIDIYLAMNDDTDDNEWERIPNWRQLTETTVYIPQQAENEDLMLVGFGIHPDLTAYNSSLSTYIPKSLAVACAKVALLEEYVNKNADDTERSWRAMYDEARRQMEQFKQELGVPRPSYKRNVLRFSSHPDFEQIYPIR